MTLRERTSNARIAAYIAGATVLLSAAVVLVVPAIADRFTAPTKTTSSSMDGGGWVGVAPGAAPPPVVAIAEPAVTTEVVPSLPEPGEQPADVAAATDAIRVSLETVFGGANSRAVRLSAVDDASNLDDAMGTAAKLYAEATKTLEAEMGEIVFTDPTHASFLFRLRYTGAPLLPSRKGSAVLVGDRWLITRSTLCDVLAIAGATCGPSTLGT